MRDVRPLNLPDVPLIVEQPERVPFVFTPPPARSARQQPPSPPPKAPTTPPPSPPREPEPFIPNGRYSVVDSTDGKLKFYRIIKGSLMVQASDDLYPVQDPRRSRRVLKEILKDPREATMRYGRELGHCGMCGRTLTDPLSRERGIGPICWTYVDQPSSREA